MKNFTFFLIPLFLLGCATGYQKSGFGGGYKDMKLQNDLYRVSFQGNAKTDRQRAADFALLRASEVALENGFKYFAIVDERADSSSFAYSTPETVHTTGTAYVRGNNIDYSGTTRFSGGQTYLFNLPNQSFIIRTFKTKPKIDGMVFDANELASNLRQQYGIKNGEKE